MTTSLIKYRGVTLPNPKKTLNNIPFNKESLIGWLGAEKMVASEYGVDAIVDYNDETISYNTRATTNITRLLAEGSVKGFKVLNAAPIATPNVDSPYNIPSLAVYAGKSTITYAMLLSVSASQYAVGQRTVLSIVSKNAGGSVVPMTRIQFNSNTSMSVASRHSSPDENTMLATINGIPAGFNVIFAELNYADKYVRLSLNGGAMLTYAAYGGTSGGNSLPTDAVGVLFGSINNDGGTIENTQFSGAIRELSVFDAKLSDSDIRELLDYLNARRAYLNT